MKTPDEAADTQKKAERASEVERRTLNAVEDSARYGYWTAWATWALVIVGIGGTIAALCTLHVIEKQTGILLRGDRPWIDMETPPGTPLDGEMATSAPLITFSTAFRNVGGSVCTVKEVCTRFHTVGNMNDLAPTPEYRLRQTMENLLVPNGNPIQFATSLEEGSISNAMLAEIRQRKRFLCYYARIVYLDGHDELHISQMCWIYDYPLGGRIAGLITEGFVKAGPKAYNKYT